MLYYLILLLYAFIYFFITLVTEENV